MVDSLLAEVDGYVCGLYTGGSGRKHRYTIGTSGGSNRYRVPKVAVTDCFATAEAIA